MDPNTRVTADEIPGFLTTVHRTLSELTNSQAPAPESPAEEQRFEPAVSVRKSLASRDHILSMIDGKPYKTLRRHLATNGLTPEQYRERYGLKSDYPMVAESYSESRRAMAKQIGLGRKPAGADAGSDAEQPAASPSPRRKKAAPAG